MTAHHDEHSPGDGGRNGARLRPGARTAGRTIVVLGVMWRVYGLGGVAGDLRVGGRLGRLREAAGALPRCRVPSVRGLRAACAAGPSASVLSTAAGAAVAWGVMHVGSALMDLLAGQARAQAEPDLLAERDGGTVALLDFLHGLADGRAGALGDMLRMFSGGLLIYAGLLVLWRMVEGAVDTARSGKAGIGGWDVLRIVAAIALLVPAPASGLGAAQHLVLSLADVGGRAASLVWEPFATGTLADGELAAPVSLPPSFRGALGSAVVSEVCMLVVNAEASAAGDPPSVERTLEEEDGGLRIGYDGARWRTRRSFRFQGDVERGSCGEIVIPLPEGDDGAVAAGEAHRAAFLAVAPGLQALGMDIAASYVPGQPSQGQAVPDLAARAVAIEAEYRHVASEGLAAAAARAAAGRPGDVRIAIRSEGWLAAGTYFNLIFRSNLALLAAAAGAPVATLPPEEVIEWSPDAAAAVGHAALQIQGTVLRISPLGVRAAGSSGAGQLVDRVFRFADVESIRIVDSGAPLADLAALGQTLLNSVVVAITALTGAATASGISRLTPFIGEGLDVFGHAWRVLDGFVTTGLMMLTVIGCVLAYLVPMLPFIRFLMGVLAWILDVVEALAAVPIWLTGHLSRSRDQLVPPGSRAAGCCSSLSCCALR